MFPFHSGLRKQIKCYDGCTPAADGSAARFKEVITNALAIVHDDEQCLDVNWWMGIGFGGERLTTAGQVDSATDISKECNACHCEYQQKCWYTCLELLFFIKGFVFSQKSGFIVSLVRI